VKPFVCLAIAIGLAFSARTASATEQTGIELLKECQSATKDASGMSSLEAMDGAHCLGYISGIEATLGLWEYRSNKAKGPLPPPACIPDEVTGLELAKVVVKYLNDHPNQLHEDYFTLVLLAFSQAYPCDR